ncbi:hypothetical protein B0T37_19645 [Chromobacterium violaceum]|uniref:CHC2 zinc finger domain-containing protein n=1 Tax=Chromobacterium violaceum TaxID=536 RepID=UPI0009D9601C|nr:CHC2 zinc finger domain-containing protein [Chromobacterium violaceum]OQS08510.1 hypothetical protein B0T38_20050 [Chromobacterium violaceum]OQS21706.1 hypothetical protein B0T37_19645 [Chromobacterium violaceum]
MERFDIGEVLAKSPLNEVARRLGIETEKRGNQLSAICPFHQDTRPSLRFFPADNGSPEHFHCFACGAHGHAIDLVKQVQSVDFLPAVQWLSQNFGIKSIRRQPKNQSGRKDTIESAQTFVLRVFDEHHDVPRFQAWCDERAFEADFLYRQGVRCVPHSVLVQELASRSTGERVELIDGLLALGLIKRLQQASHSDQYKLSFPDQFQLQFQDYFHDGRVLIPIYGGAAKRPELVGFAGRALLAVPPEGVPKYLLSPGFQKAKYLFNAPSAFSSAMGELRDGDTATLYLVEGFLDALRLQALGLNAVALMGTSLSDGQLELLKHFVDGLPQSKAEFVLSIFLDNDKAGFAGADRLVRRLLGLSGVDLRWIGLDGHTNRPLGKDPDTCLKVLSSRVEATDWLQDFNRPAEAALLVSELGDIDASELPNERWAALNSSARERAVFKTATTIRQVRGSRPLQSVVQRLKATEEDWATELCELLGAPEGAQRDRSSVLFLQGLEERLSHARNLAYYGSRRGELPCDEESWLTLDLSARLFDLIAQQRLAERGWIQAAPYDAVHLPRKLTANTTVLDDPRRKVMPHPADLHLHQVLLNELLTQRHDLLSVEGKTFSEWIPAVRWFSATRKVEVTGPFDDLPAAEGEEATLSFGYQVDMDVLEGSKTPSDQGMFRPYGQCWRDFMSSLSRQCHAIGGRVHVLRLDAQRYYDSIQRYVVRDALLDSIKGALTGTGAGIFGPLLGRSETGSTQEVAEALVDRVCNFLFGHQYRHPNTSADGDSLGAIGIPQGPVLSAYIGTIALFPVDVAARRFMRRNVRPGLDGMNLPRVGYARYVDDIVLFADSEALLAELREVLQTESAKLSISLINKGERVRSGTPEQVMHQLNEGRSLAASVPAWEPPFVGDGESGWGLGGDMPEVDRQCALKMLRHPALMDEPKLIQEQVRQAIQAPDLRPNDLGLCARWLWWQVATELLNESPQNDPSAAWSRYWQLWRHVCEGHDWAAEFERRGYTQLYAVEGLDKLLDSNPWMENEQTHSEVPQQRAIRTGLAKLVISAGFFSEVRPAENNVHVQRRARLVASKARRLFGGLSTMLLSQPQDTQPVTAIEWLCMAAELIRADPVDTAGAEGTPPLLAPIKKRDALGAMDAVAWQVCEVLRLADTPDGKPGNVLPNPALDEVTRLALGLVIDNAIPDQRLAVLTKFPGLLSIRSNGDRLSLVQRLPITETTSLWALGEPQNGARYLYRFSLPPSPLASRDLACVELASDGMPEAKLETLSFEPTSLDPQSCSPQLVREKSIESVSWSKFDLEPSPDLRLTELAVRLFVAVVAMQRKDTGDADLMYVPFTPQLFRSGDAKQPTLHLVAEPMKRHLLGVSAWYRDGDGRVRTVSVPHAGADLWRAGWVVADALGMAVDMLGETGLRDEQLSDKTTISVEHYLLRQQLRKLQGVYLSEAQTLRKDEQTGLPRTVMRALQLLSEFDGRAEPDQQVRQLLVMEAETRAMALRIQQQGSESLHALLHQVFPAVLNKLPLWAIDCLALPNQPAEYQPLRPDLALMLSLCTAMEGYWGQGGAAHHHAATPALRAALALATAGAGLRGSVAALWGLTQARGALRMPERLDLPAAWSLPDMVRTDPQSDYRAMRQWLIEGDWSALCRASPWHWMLALTGLLGANFPQAFELPQLQQVFTALAAWQSQLSAEDGASVWPYDGLPVLEPQQWATFLDALPQAIRQIDDLLGMRVAPCAAPRYRRNPHTGEFTDASNQDWLLGKSQFTGLGAVDRIARRTTGGRILNVWTETRRKADDELLAVHTLDRKLGAWLERADHPEAAYDGTGAPVVIPSEKPAGEIGEQVMATSVADVAESAPDLAQSSADEPTEKPAGDIGEQVLATSVADVAESAPDLAQSSADEPTEKPADVDRLAEHLDISQKQSRKSRADKNSKAHFRVALFQWQVEDTYSHPLSEVGLRGLPISEGAKTELRGMFAADGDLSVADKAAKRGEEHQWTNNVKVMSWHEHRRRTLIRQALNACKDLGVQLLVLPEVSVRGDTIEWLEGVLKDFEGLAVLAGTYRHFSTGAKDRDHLRAPLTLLWRPETEMAKALGLGNENTTFKFERGKKYRAVAANELFRPDLSRLSPLYTEEKLMEEVKRELNRRGRSMLGPDQLPELAHALVHLSPPLRYCMELICSELFLLTSPANFEPLRKEVNMLLQRFPSYSEDTKTLIRDDIEAVGELLTVAQRNRERRSVLLVPAFTSRSNDYWHAGQASVLASGTATVFCNAAHKNSAGGSCFIGINSVSRSSETAGIVSSLTPYHGWQKGILQANSEGALSKNDQALVVVDIDPVHVVSGKPRPQLLPEPMSLVAYLPVIELMNKNQTADGVVRALESELEDPGMGGKARKLLAATGFHAHDKFYRAYQALLNEKGADISKAHGAKALDDFVKLFADPDALRKRFLAWQDERHQQPSFVSGSLQLEPAWLDFLVADVTCIDQMAKVRVPPWKEDLGTGGSSLASDS